MKVAKKDESDNRNIHSKGVPFATWERRCYSNLGKEVVIVILGKTRRQEVQRLASASHMPDVGTGNDIKARTKRARCRMLEETRAQGFPAVALLT